MTIQNSNSSKYFQSLYQERMEAKKHIDEFVLTYEPIKTLFFISKYYYKETIEHPIVSFLYNLYLKQPFKERKIPLLKEINKLKKYLVKYCTLFNLYSEKEEYNPLAEKAKDQYILNLINPEMYPHQYREKFEALFSNIKCDFFKEFGFYPMIACDFAQTINSIYRKRFITNSKFFLFTIDDLESLILSKNSSIKSKKAFRDEALSYLKIVSIELGKESQKYNSLLDEDFSWKKPIIKTQDGYLGINTIQNTHGLFVQLENLIKNKAEVNKTLWKKYRNSKSKYAESLAYQSFKKIFKKEDCVYKNLRYQHSGKDREIDILIKYGNYFIIGEVKSGSLKIETRNGKSLNLERDLKKLIGKSYNQTKNVADYIVSKNDLVFYKGNKPINIEKPTYSKIFSICISIENIMMITQNLKAARLEKFFRENQYPYAVNLLELEIILDCIEYPSLFINYIESRLNAQKNEKTLIQAADELSYFGMYLTEGPYGGFNFSNKLSSVTLSPSYVEPFDKYYGMRKGKKPKVNLDLRLKRFINEWEDLNIKNQLFSSSKEFSKVNDENINTSPDIANILHYLLQFDKDSLKTVFDQIEDCIQKTRVDKKHHSYSWLLKDFCINFHSNTNLDELYKYMLIYAEMKKYQQKKDLVLSLGSYVNNEDPFFINSAIILSFPYKKDTHLDKILDYHREYGQLKK